MDQRRALLLRESLQILLPLPPFLRARALPPNAPHERRSSLHVVALANPLARDTRAALNAAHAAMTPVGRPQLDFLQPRYSGEFTFRAIT
jgi:hypothetical protein